MLRRSISILFAAALIVLSGCGGAEKLQGQVVIIENVTAIDAANGVRTGVDIVINNKRIEAVGASAAARYTAADPKRVTKIDGSAQYVIPGLWDTHVHLTFTPGLDHRTFFPLSIAHGVTSLRDTGGHLEQLKPAIAAAQQDPLAPNFYFSGPLVDGAKRVYDGRSPFYPDLSVGATTPDEARKIVDDLAAAGVHFVKAYEMLTPEAFTAVTEQARKHGLPVAAHIPLSMTAREAIDAGVNDMQHLRNLELACVDDSADLKATRLSMLEANDAAHAGALRSAIHKDQRERALSQQDDNACSETIAALASANVYQTPTLTISRFQVRKLYADEKWKETFSLVPLKIGQGWHKRSARLESLQPNDLALAYDAWILNIIPKLRDAGVPFLAGTDAPIAYLTPGASLHEELIMLVDAGLTEMQALQAATQAPAQFMDLEDTMGQIAPGMVADLVLLRKDPLVDIRNASAIETVVKGGLVIDRLALDQMMAGPAKLAIE